MIDIQTPLNITANHFMCSQSGNISDLGALSGHSPSYILGPDAEPNSSSRHDFAHAPSQTSDMGLRYMTLTSSDDVRFSEAGTNNPVSSIEPSVSNYAPSTLSFSPYTSLYHHTLNGPTCTSGASNYYPPTSTYLSMTDKQPRLTSLNSSSGLVSLSRSPGLPHPSSPINTRDIYTGATPVHLRRTSDLLSRSPSFSSTARGVPLSPSSTASYTSPTNMESSLGSACPPLHPTEVIYQLQTPDGVLYKPDIYAKIDKGFFLADKDWTCYRRNYFSLNCSYTILPQIPNGALHLCSQHGSGAEAVNGFAMTISAVVDGSDGKPIELVQHTPKRDKGPQQRPDRVSLQPRQPQQHGSWGDNSLGASSRGLYDSPGFNPTPNQPPIEAMFERIQFKNATANNGKRRAAQQYYHIIVELYADLGQHHPDRWVKIATRMSAQMVVRGRSPGHYQSERRGSNASSGPGSGGASGGGSYPPSNVSRTPGDMGGSSSMLPGSGYGGGYDGRSHQYRANIPPLQIPLEPTLAAEEAKSIVETPDYQYYPAPIYESPGSRYQHHGVSQYSVPKIKNEYGSGGNFLPSLTNADGMSRHCGRWEGFPESKGYFPTALIQHEMNIT